MSMHMRVCSGFKATSNGSASILVPFIEECRGFFAEWLTSDVRSVLRVGTSSSCMVLQSQLQLKVCKHMRARAAFYFRCCEKHRTLYLHWFSFTEGRAAAHASFWASCALIIVYLYRHSIQYSVWSLRFWRKPLQDICTHNQQDVWSVSWNRNLSSTVRGCL